MDEQKNSLGRMWSLYKIGGLTPAIASMLGSQNAQQMAFIRSVMKEQRKQSMFETPIAELEFVVFDLETTGFHPSQGDEIISVGAVLVEGTRPRHDRFFYSLINPKRNIPQKIIELTGITQAMANDAPDLLEVLHRFLEFADKRILIAHGGGHDRQFLNAALWKTTRIMLTHRFLDTMMIYRWLHPKESVYDLDALLERYGIPVSERHHALEDAKMTAILWEKLMIEVQDRNVHTLGDLYAYLSQ
ncbi:exonuclease domain-containing protein [Ferviditalea candida]|uniref:Exonuclease domain-containing protein n=1 Tax=Ferviditalea candida TaxID=3108399 RepID=A0ABU5ZEW9_9BACL|nr:exonuclease domain-containing protein [Paenibacillaceae bacterium T2]